MRRQLDGISSPAQAAGQQAWQRGAPAASPSSAMFSSTASARSEALERWERTLALSLPARSLCASVDTVRDSGCPEELLAEGGPGTGAPPPGGTTTPGAGGAAAASPRVLSTPLPTAATISASEEAVRETGPEAAEP